MRLLAPRRSNEPAGPVQPLLSLWHSFKKCISKKAHSVRSIRWTDHVAYGVKEHEEVAQHWEPAHPSLIQPSPASPMIDFQNSVGNPRQTQLLRHGTGSDALNDVNYLATNDSNTPERSSEQSDTSLPCRFKPFKCKSTCDSPRRHNSCLSSKCTSNW